MTSDRVRNILGAFADCAVLFPLVVLLGSRGILPTAAMFFSAGLAYILAGFYFRIPMPVQPLKSIAIASLALGATSAEIRVSAALLGLVCLVVLFFKWDRWLELVPMRLIRLIQAGLAALLLTQAWRTLGTSTPLVLAFTFVLASSILLLPEWRGIPWMGLAAAAGMTYAVLQGSSAGSVLAPSEWSSLRWTMVAGLVLPQVVLTFANSVLGTRAAAQVYFRERAERVTVRALLNTIGWGNVLVAVFGGLPFCHGSGGLTAHVRGGSSAWWSNAVIGGFLLILGIVSTIFGMFIPVVPIVFVAALLFVTGIQHLALTAITQAAWLEKIKLVLGFGIVLATQNLLWALFLGLCWEGFDYIFARSITLARGAR